MISRFIKATASWLALTMAATACGAATRAEIHEEDFKKVFPFPRDKQEVTIRVKPLTTMANTCVWFGSYEEVTVTPQTTFYITDELDKEFAYTPSRSPMRRLAPVQSMEIRWPIRPPTAPAEEDQADEKKEDETPPDKGGQEPPAKTETGQAAP